MEDSSKFIGLLKTTNMSQANVNLLDKIIYLTQQYIYPTTEAKISATDTGFMVCYDTR